MYNVHKQKLHLGIDPYKKPVLLIRMTKIHFMSISTNQKRLIKIN